MKIENFKLEDLVSFGNYLLRVKLSENSKFPPEVTISDLQDWFSEQSLDINPSMNLKM